MAVTEGFTHRNRFGRRNFRSPSPITRLSPKTDAVFEADHESRNSAEERRKNAHNRNGRAVFEGLNRDCSRLNENRVIRVLVKKLHLFVWRKYFLKLFPSLLFTVRTFSRSYDEKTKNTYVVCCTALKYRRHRHCA